MTPSAEQRTRLSKSVRRLARSARIGVLVALIFALGGGLEARAPELTPRSEDLRSAPAPAPAGIAHAAVVEAGPAEEDGTYSVAVLDRATGELEGNRNRATPLYSASLVKLVVAIDVLQRRSGGLHVEESDLALIRRSLSASDDDAMNTLWDRFQGAEAVERVAAQLRLTTLRPPSSPGNWGDTLLSATDMVLLFDHVLTRMPPPERDLIMGALDSASPIAAGGFDQAYGFDARAVREPTATKGGWMCCRDGEISMHSAAVVGPSRRFVAAILSTHAGGSGYSPAKESVTDLAEHLLRKLR